MVRILFVCTGNICRSPVAQGVFEDVARREGLAEEITVDSAGTHGFYTAGEPPDPRAQESVLARGIDISVQRARLFDPEDCERFDYILTMDEQTTRRSRPSARERSIVRPFLDYATDSPERRSPTRTSVDLGFRARPRTHRRSLRGPICRRSGTNASVAEEIIASGVEVSLGERLKSARPMGGGCIGEVYRVELEDGTPLVAKVDREGESHLEREAYMLRYLREKSDLPVPEVYHGSETLLLMEFVEGSSRFSEGAERHAAELLAALHGITADAYGHERDTLIGSLDQPNPWTGSWAEFFREQRLLYMARIAHDAGRLPAEDVRRLERIIGEARRDHRGAKPSGAHPRRRLERQRTGQRRPHNRVPRSRRCTTRTPRSSCPSSASSTLSARPSSNATRRSGA